MQKLAAQESPHAVLNRAAPAASDNQLVLDPTASLIDHLKLRCLVTHVTDMQPGAPLIQSLPAPLFHYVVLGRCRFVSADHVLTDLTTGDLVVSFQEVPHEIQAFESLGQWADELRPSQAKVLSGQIMSSGSELLPLLANIPFRIIHAAKWGENSLLGRILPMITPELVSDRQGGSAVVNLLLTLAVVEILRDQLRTSRADATGWMNALQDEEISPILAAMLRQPEYPWSVERLAAVSCMARSTFARRFREVVGEAPMDALTNIRMQIATDLLRCGANVKDIARRVGYGSIQSFTSAFRRKFGMTPYKYRNLKSDSPAEPNQFAWSQS